MSGREADPRICLVLSGGGARGSAHVGVLKALEEMRIPLHCVVGTSMGAIVGGLYATGVSPSQMEDLLAETDWRSLFDDRLPRRQVPYRQKVDDQTYLTRFEAGFNGGRFQLPSGLVSGHKIGFALQEMMLRSIDVEDFDDLSLPFRAVATDIVSAERVVLESGDLARAVRASMSIPGIFSPVELDGRLLVDGGFADNLPVDVARDLGADVVIAVNVGEEPLSKEELSSLGRVMGQITGMQIWSGSRRQAADADVLVTPELDGFSSTEFEQGLEMVPAGEAAAREKAADLAPYSVPEAEFEEYLGRIRREPPAELMLTSVAVTAESEAGEEWALRTLDLRPGEVVGLERIRRNLDRLYETGDYERVDFSLQREAGGYGLHVEAREKSWGPNYLRFGASLFSDFSGESNFGALASYTMTKLNARRGEIKVRAEVGENPSVAAEVYQPLTRAQTWFVAVGGAESRSTVYSPVGQNLFAPYRAGLLSGAVDLGLQLDRFGVLRLGLTRGRFVSRIRGDRRNPPSPDLPEEVDGDLGGIRFTAVFDQFDNMNFPREGYFAVVNYLDSRRSLGADQDYERLDAFLGGAASHGRHTLLGLVTVASALGTDSPETRTLGRLFALSGYRPEEVVGRYGGSAALVYLYRLFDLPSSFGDGLYVGGSLEAGNLWNQQDDVDLGDLLTSGTLTVGLDTLLGPVYLSLGFTEDGDGSAALFLGRTF